MKVPDDMRMMMLLSMMMMMMIIKAKPHTKAEWKSSWTYGYCWIRRNLAQNDGDMLKCFKSVFCLLGFSCCFCAASLMLTVSMIAFVMSLYLHLPLSLSWQPWIVSRTFVLSSALMLLLIAMWQKEGDLVKEVINGMPWVLKVNITKRRCLCTVHHCPLIAIEYTWQWRKPSRREEKRDMISIFFVPYTSFYSFSWVRYNDEE